MGTALNTLMGMDMADTLGIEIHLMPDRVVRGSAEREIQIGPWTVKNRVVFIGDEVEALICSGFAKLGGDLWAYLTWELSGKASILLIDGAKAKLSVGGVRSEWCTGSSVKTTARLREKNVVVTGYDYDEQEWRPL